MNVIIKKISSFIKITYYYFRRAISITAADYKSGNLRHTPCKILNGFIIVLQRKTGLRIPITFAPPIDGLYAPKGVETLAHLQTLFRERTVNFTQQGMAINIFIPEINKDLIFGGYISLYNFTKRALQKGYHVRLVLCSLAEFNKTSLEDAFGPESAVGYTLRNSEVVRWDEGRPLECSARDVFMGYSWFTMRMAAKVAEKVNRLPTFFIQEYESIFYPYNSVRALCDETYSLPHHAIFNSPILENFFKRRKMSVFDNAKTDGASISFKHTFAAIPPPTKERLASRKKKKVLFYARPEEHAARNLFELGALALIENIHDGTFDDGWEFVGIGSLQPLPEVKLAKGQTLQMFQRVSYDEYKKILSEYDIGLCLMYAPHPSVPPFEMASAGMVTITTTFEHSRTAEDLNDVSSNIVACEPTLAGVVAALKEAVEKVSDLDDRIEGAQLDWPRDWDDSFSDKFFDKFDSLIVRGK